jgi:AraC-like DNA-binding protein
MDALQAPRSRLAAPAAALRHASRLLVHAQEDLNRLHNILRHAGYDVLLYDNNGTVIDRRSHQSQHANSIAERLTLQPNEVGRQNITHLRARHLFPSQSELLQPRLVAFRSPTHRTDKPGPSCLPVPIFDADGTFIGSLAVVPQHREQNRLADALVLSLLRATARTVEERVFRDRYRKQWIIAARPHDASRPAMLLAVDQHQKIVGADRCTRALLADKVLTTNAGQIFAATLWLLFEGDPTLFRTKRREGDTPTLLLRARTGEPWSALITPPDCIATTWKYRDPALHTRARIDSIGCARASLPALPARGGLSPSTLRRVRTHIDANLEADIDLKILARKAGLSRWYFARAFKQSVGMTAHCYLMQRRIARARELLAETDVPLAEIALETGFADQSHFSRRFREHLSISPSSFRRANR